MKLKDLIDRLIDLENLGGTGANENMQVFTVRGSSGDTGEPGFVHISNHVGEAGPFDLEPGEEYVCISVD